MIAVLAVAQLAVLVAFGWSAHRFAARIDPHARRSEHALVALLIAAAACSVTVQGLSLVGALGGPGLVAVALGQVALAWRFGDEPRESVDEVPLAVRPALAVALAITVAFAVGGVVGVPDDWDDLTYHLLKPLQWLVAGRVGITEGPAPLDILAYNPTGGESVLAVAMGVVRTDLFVRAVLGWPYVVGTALGTAALASRLGADTTQAWTAGLLVWTVPVSMAFAATGMVDPLVATALVTATLMLVRSVDDDDVRIAALGGLAVGVAAGAKVTALVPAVALFGGFAWSALRHRAPGQLGAFAGVAALVGGASYLRNIVATGNPVYPFPIGPLPGRHLLWFPLDTPIWKGLGSVDGAITILLAWIGPTGLGLGLKMIALPVLAVALLASLRGADRRVVLVLALIGMFAWGYFGSPMFDQPAFVFTNVRFGLPAVLLATALAAKWLPGDGRALWAGAIAICGIVLDAVLLDPMLPWIGQLGSWLVVLVAALAIFAAGAVGPVGTRWAPALAVALAALMPAVARVQAAHRWELLSAPVGVGHVQVPRAVVPGAIALDGLGPRVVALAGLPMQMAAIYAGGDVDRRLVFVEAGTGRRDDVPPSEETSMPAFDPRTGLDRDLWLANLRAEHVDALIVVRRGGPWTIEARWAEELGFREVHADEFSRVFAVGP